MWSYVERDVGRYIMHAGISVGDHDALLNEIQTANVLNLSSRTLQAWRIRGYGPAFVRAGRAIRYRRSDLIGWIEANTVSSTPSSRAASDQTWKRQ